MNNSRLVGILLGIVTGVFITLGVFPFLFIVTAMAGGDAEALSLLLLCPALVAGAYAGWIVGRRRVLGRDHRRPSFLVRAYAAYALVLIPLGLVFEDRSGKGAGFLVALVVTYLPFKYLLSRHPELFGGRRNNTSPPKAGPL